MQYPKDFLNKIIHGNCLEIMKYIPNNSIDLILCDMPYGTTNCKWDTRLDLNQLWKEIKRIRKDNTAIILFGTEPFSSLLRMSNIKEYKYDLYWVKEKPTNFFQLKKRFGKLTENIIIFYKKQCKFYPQKIKVDRRVKNKPKGFHNSILTGKNKKIYPYKDDGTRFPCDLLYFNRVKLNKYIHHTQKPLKLIEYLIESFSDEKDVVLDFCIGSGTTAIASINHNRYFIGIEINKDFVDLARKRIDKNE